MAATQGRNVGILSVALALNTMAVTVSITLNSLVGAMLAPQAALATLPITMTVLGTAATTVPAALLMRRFSRRVGFLCGALAGGLNGLICAYALYIGSFALFCAGTFLAGIYNAFAQYYRFAAADNTPLADHGKVISYVLAGGILAAVAGPELAKWSKDLLLPYSFLGSYLALLALALAAGGLLSFLDISPLSAAQRAGPTRPLRAIIRQPAFVVAVMGGMFSYGVMTLVMTSTPLAMLACGLKVDDAAFVIQWHSLGMFAPSLIAGHLIRRFGVLAIMLTGTLLLTACALVALTGIDLTNFAIANLLLGVGWNFTFIGATTLLTEVYSPAERAKVQALNDFSIFCVVAGASFLSGVLLHYFGWRTVVALSLPFILIVVAVTGWLGYQRRAARRMA
jgi:MFS family permease